MPRPSRQYEQVSSNEQDGNLELEEEPRRSSTTTLDAPRSARQTYSQLSQGGEPAEEEKSASEQPPVELSQQTESGAPAADNQSDSVITVTILDYTQKRFQVSVHPDDTVATLKLQGSKIHKVAPDRQRLIFCGRLLEDDKTMRDVGIHTNELIVHLFPKPRVVIKDESSSVATSEAEPDEGARVPTIVLDAAEAERRSQILVLGSADYMEAQNNVKMFSFMLLIISSIELMNLMAVALGVEQEDEEDFVAQDDIWPDPQPHYNHTASADELNMLYQQWGIPNWIDLLVSILGVYVALLGLRASSLNTLRLAKQYLYGTVLVGIGWMLFNYFMTYEVDKAVEEQRERNDDNRPHVPDNDLASQALSVMVLPGMVWFLCFVRAWQFHYLLHQAEQEAEERIRNETTQDEELALQNQSSTIA